MTETEKPNEPQANSATFEQRLQSLANKYHSLELPPHRSDLVHLEEPLRTELQDALDALHREVPKTSEPCFYALAGLTTGFIDDLTILAWLHYLLVSARFPPAEAIEKLRAFYSVTTIEADIYVFFHGLDAIEFGDNATYKNFVVGTALKNGHVDGIWIPPKRPYTFSAQDFFIKTRCTLQIGFGSAASDESLRQRHIAVTAILDPLSSKLQLLEAELRAPLQPFSYHSRFDPLVSPLALSVDHISEFVGAHRSWFGRKPHLTRDGVVRLWHQYDSMLPELKDRLELPLRWVSKSLHAHEPIDAMIAVGIALEALFVDKDIQEQLAYRLQLNGSLWLENAPDKRRVARKDLNDAYAARSKSVHGSAKQIDPEVVARGRELARRGILLALERNFLPAKWNAWIVERFPALADSAKPDDATS